MSYFGVITLNGQIASKLKFYIALVAGSILGLALICSVWRCGKRHQRRLIARRWQSAYLMVRAHLETKKQVAEALAAVDDDALDDGVRPAAGTGSNSMGVARATVRMDGVRQRTAKHPFGAES
jgi:hypothetical protein